MEKRKTKEELRELMIPDEVFEQRLNDILERDHMCSIFIIPISPDKLAYKLSQKGPFSQKIPHSYLKNLNYTQ